MTTNQIKIIGLIVISIIISLSVGVTIGRHRESSLSRERVQFITNTIEVVKEPVVDARYISKLANSMPDTLFKANLLFVTGAEMGGFTPELGDILHPLAVKMLEKLTADRKLIEKQGDL